MKPYLKSISGGMMTTVQDFGRLGHQSQGVPVGGALDPVMLRLANALVGNSEGLGALEIRIMGPTFKVAADSIRVALTGTTMPLEILKPKRETVSPCRSVRLERDQVFRIQTVSDSACCYLAVEGGFDVPTIYDSQSTYVFGGFGGFEGRPIREGDHVPLNSSAATSGPDSMVVNTFDQDDGGPIRVVLGPQADYFTEAGISTFLENEYTVTNDSNRMGLRTEGPVIEHARGFNITSDGISAGSIQVPGTGLPIILLADRQTTGGYPKIATVISADLRRLGRLQPGSVFRFKAVEVAEAEHIRRVQEEEIQKLLAAIGPISDEATFTAYLLHTVNLIDGVYGGAQ